jgi:pectate lyase C
MGGGVATGGTGAGLGGSSGTGGTATSPGGQFSTATGGTATGGSATGGVQTGGTATTGGTAAGGDSSGGRSFGGRSAGGRASGGESSGGRATGGESTGGDSTGGVSFGGRTGGGGRSMGGSGTGGTATGGVSTGGRATGGTGTGGVGTGGTTSTPPNIGPAACGCTQSSGEYSGNNIKSTIVVDAGENYDGGCKTFRADPGTLGDGSQDEGQSPVFRVNGGTLSNVILGASAADGIHIYGNTTLKNIHWLDIGEDAMTIKETATLTLDCGSSNQGDDKTFQVNAASTVTIKNFTAKNAGKFMRQNGDTTFKMTAIIDHCDISGMDECIFRTDSTTSTVTLSNTRYSNIGDSLFIFGDNNVNGNSSQSTVTNCQSY